MSEIHPRLSLNRVSFIDASIDEFFECCRTLGARNVVLLGRDVQREGGLAATRRALDRNRLRVAAIHHRFAVYPDLEHDHGEAVDRLLPLIEIGAELGTPSIYVSTGGRGSLDWEDAAERFHELVAPAASAAEERGLRLLVETVGASYADRHIAHTLADTISLAERAGIGVCLELFYIWSEGRLDDQIRRAVPRCGLVQVSDYVLGDDIATTRAVPGDGVIPLERLLGKVLDAGYTGVFDLEVVGPRVADEGALRAITRAARHVGSLLTALGASPTAY